MNNTLRIARVNYSRDTFVLSSIFFCAFFFFLYIFWRCASYFRLSRHTRFRSQKIRLFISFTMHCFRCFEITGHYVAAVGSKCLDSTVPNRGLSATTATTTNGVYLQRHFSTSIERLEIKCSKMSVSVLTPQYETYRLPPSHCVF